jgi:hypothetical protein
MPFISREVSARVNTTVLQSRGSSHNARYDTRAEHFVFPQSIIVCSIYTCKRTHRPTEGEGYANWIVEDGLRRHVETTRMIVRFHRCWSERNVKGIATEHLRSLLAKRTWRVRLYMRLVMAQTNPEERPTWHRAATG